MGRVSTTLPWQRRAGNDPVIIDGTIKAPIDSVRSGQFVKLTGVDRRVVSVSIDAFIPAVKRRRFSVCLWMNAATTCEGSADEKTTLQIKDVDSR